MIPASEETWKKLDAAIEDIARIAMTGISADGDCEVVAAVMHAMAAFLVERRLRKEPLKESGGLSLAASVADCLLVCPTGFVVSPPADKNGPILYRVLAGSRSLDGLLSKYPLPLGTITYLAAQVATEGTV